MPDFCEHPLGFTFYRDDVVEIRRTPNVSWEPASFVDGLPSSQRAEVQPLRTGLRIIVPLAQVRPRHAEFPPLVATMIRTAQYMTEPGEPNYEYIRGQAELICDLAGLGMDEHRDGVMSQIMLGHTAAYQH